MTQISLFTPINLAQPQFYAEKAPLLTNYLYLKGARITEEKGNDIQLENGEFSWKATALKVIFHILLFPITLTFSAVNLVRHFTILGSEAIIKEPTEMPIYAQAFYNDLSISSECRELFKLIFVDIINPDTIESIQPLENLVGEDGKLTNKLREFNAIHCGKDTLNHLSCRGSAHSSTKSDPWQTIKITAPNISELGKTSPILLELKQNLDKHYHLKSGGGSNWQQWLKLSFEDKIKQNKQDPLCFNQNNTVMTPQLLLTLIDLRKILGIFKSDNEYITALEKAYLPCSVKIVST